MQLPDSEVQLDDLLIRGDFAALHPFYAKLGMPTPRIVWSPQVDDLAQAQLRFLLTYWRGLQDDTGRVWVGSIDALDMRPALGYIMLLDVLDGGVDFRYRLYGSVIAQHSNFDMTGRCLSELKPEQGVGAFFRVVYRAILARPEPIYTEHAPPPTIRVKLWYRLILPLFGEDDRVSRLLVGNVPGEWRNPDLP